MTIAQAFNEIAVAQGGTASKGGTIAGAIDALTDALAGSDVNSPSTIEGAVRLLGEHIGGGGGSQLGEQVTLKAASGLDDFSFDVFLGNTYVAFGSTTTEGVPVAAGTTIKMAASSGRTGTYTIGEGESQALVREGDLLKFDIPVDTPEGTSVTVDGDF